MAIAVSNSGIEESLFLTKFATKVTVLEANDRLGASRILQDKAAGHPKIDIRLGTTIQEFRGNGHLSSVVMKDLKTDQTEELTPGAVFIFIGLDPNTGVIKDSVELDQWGFVKTDKSFETSLSGVFAAGDVRAGSTKQVASAVGEGAAAAIMIRQYLESEQGSRASTGS